MKSRQSSRVGIEALRRRQPLPRFLQQSSQLYRSEKRAVMPVRAYRVVAYYVLGVEAMPVLPQEAS